MRLDKPWYWWQPTRLARRSAAADRAVTAWGDELEVLPGEPMGHSMARLGVFELALSEALWRLTDPADRVVDVGANLGYTTAIVLRRLGPDGRLVCLEANPPTAALLRRNVRRLDRRGQAVVHEQAAGAVDGVVELFVPADPLMMGTASTVAPDGAAGSRVSVPAVRLDALVDGPVGVLKVDVEGAERSVLDGAAGLFAARRVRDVLCEAEGEDLDEVVAVLEGHGLTCAMLDRSFFGPRLRPVGDTRVRDAFAARTLLATLDSDRLRARLGPRGWRCLQAGRRPASSR